MVELSSLLFKPVIDRDTSNVVGRIKNAYFSQGCNSIAYFVISSDKCDCDSLLPIGDVLCFSDAIVIQNDSNVRCVNDVDFTLFSNGIIGMEVYTQNGILKGKIQQVEFSKSGKVTKLCTENEQFTPQNVACVGDVILLKTAKQKKAAKAAIPRPKTETKVFVLSTEKQSSHAESIPSDVVSSENKGNFPDNENLTSISSDFIPMQITSAPLATQTSPDSPYFSNNALKMLDAPSVEDDGRTPARIISDYSFLLGRMLSGNLTSYTGTILAQTGAIVNDDLVEKARLAGKLVDLVLLAKLDNQ